MCGRLGRVDPSSDSNLLRIPEIFPLYCNGVVILLKRVDEQLSYTVHATALLHTSVLVKGRGGICYKTFPMF